jgi:isochorismate synthase
MNIEQSISEGKYLARVVLPSEIDEARNIQYFEFDGENFQSDHNEGTLIIEPFREFSGIAPQPETTQMQHASVVAAALNEIDEGLIKKVVVSCIKHEPRNTKSLDVVFSELIANYPNAFVFVLNHPQHGAWMGATPELLLRKEDQNFQTVSLAGTQLYSGEKEIQWSDKLKSEQSLVTDFILESLSKCGAMNITGAIDSTEIIRQLQPTPAVCGVPRKAALQFIDRHSNFERRLYAGRIGLAMPNNRELHFVTLRCMQIFSDHFEIHVGGGIVAQSNAYDEWNETEIKANVLRKFLH